MSYILDALRRADAERERSRGSVPGLHAQQLPPGAPRDTRTRASGRWLWLAAGGALLLVAAVAWQWLSHDGAPATPTELSRAAQGTVTPPPVVPPPPPAAMAPEAPPGAAPSASPPPSPTANTAPPPTVSAVPPTLDRPAAPPRALPAAAPRKPPGTELATARPGAAPAKPASAASSGAVAAARVMSRNELPEDVQRGLPTLTVGGASYSQNPESRMLIVNGQIYREGDQLAPNVSLEQIRLKEAVIATKGYRYRIDY